MDSGQGERLIKVLTQIKDRLPAATTPPAPESTPWEIVRPKTQVVLHAWLTADNQIAWLPRGSTPIAGGCRKLYVGGVDA